MNLSWRREGDGAWVVFDGDKDLVAFAADKEGLFREYWAFKMAQAQPERLLFAANSATSRNAAFEARNSSETYRKQIVEHLVNMGDYGATRDELSRALGIKIQTVCARVDELMESGAIRKTERTRRTSSGKPATVLVVS